MALDKSCLQALLPFIIAILHYLINFGTLNILLKTSIIDLLY